MWYQKTPRTVNVMLRQAILDVLPLDLNKTQADVILRTVLETIVKGVKRDGAVTIEGLGRFYKHYRPARYRGYGIPTGKRRLIKSIGRKYYPESYEVRFAPNRSLKRSLIDKGEGNGDSRTNQA